MTACNKVKPEDLARAAQVLDRAFAPLPVQQLFARSIQEVPFSEPVVYEEHMEGMYYIRLMALAEADGVDIVEADDFGGVAVWSAPWSNPPAPDFGESSRNLVLEYKEKLDAVKEKHGFSNRKDWHLTSVGRDPDNRVKGTIRKLFDPYLAKSRETGHGASLDAINEHARDVYQHLGFRVIDSFQLGTGQVDKHGDYDPQGEGLSVYYMLYD